MMIKATTLRCSTGILSAMLMVGAISSPVAGAAKVVHHKAVGQILGIVEEGGSRLEGAVVSITEVPGTFGAPKAPVIMDQKDKEFVPNVMAILKGTTVRFSNSDPFFHNVFSSSRVKTFNVSQEKKGDTTDLIFDKIGIVPIRCHIHANMKAFIVVLSNPYFAVTNAHGLFKIGNVPAGSYTVKAWSPKTGSVTQTVAVPASGEARVIFKLGS